MSSNEDERGEGRFEAKLYIDANYVQRHARASLLIDKTIQLNVEENRRAFVAI